MKPRLLGTYVPGSPEWHAARRWRIGGSEIDRQLEIKLLAHGKRFIQELTAAAARQQAA